MSRTKASRSNFGSRVYIDMQYRITVLYLCVRMKADLKGGDVDGSFVVQARSMESSEDFALRYTYLKMPDFRGF